MTFIPNNLGVCFQDLRYMRAPPKHHCAGYTGEQLQAGADEHQGEGKGRHRRHHEQQAHRANQNAQQSNERSLSYLILLFIIK